jgi:hypothetical protein
VDSAPLFDLLSTTNNQVIYGRRGTGKTHALKYLAEVVERRGDHPIYLDLRAVGSNGSIYSDDSRPLSERASTLIVDVLSGLFDELYGMALALIERHPNPEEVTRRIDDLQSAISTIRIAGTTEVEDTNASSQTSSKGLGMKFGLSQNPSSSFEANLNTAEQNNITRRVRRTGGEIVHLSFGNIAASVGNLVDILRPTARIWLLIDEWSEIPIELQPYLADLLRRTLLPLNEITGNYILDNGMRMSESAAGQALIAAWAKAGVRPWKPSAEELDDACREARQLVERFNHLASG